MKLLTKTLEKQIPKYEMTQDTPLGDLTVYCKFFNPTGRGTWYVTNYDPETRICTGWVSIFGDYNDEFGDFSLQELEEFKGRFGLGIERDRFFTPCKLKEIKGVIL